MPIKRNSVTSFIALIAFLFFDNRTEAMMPELVRAHTHTHTACGPTRGTITTNMGLLQKLKLMILAEERLGHYNFTHICGGNPGLWVCFQTNTPKPLFLNTQQWYLYYFFYFFFLEGGISLHLHFWLHQWSYIYHIIYKNYKKLFLSL